MPPAGGFPATAARLECGSDEPSEDLLKYQGRHYRTIWPAADALGIEVIDQTLLPFRFEIRQLRSCAQVEAAIRTMVVRGAPLIGAAAAYGLALAMREDASDGALATSIAALRASRPTAVNLGWALDRMHRILRHAPPAQRFDLAWREAARICDEDAESCRAIGRNGLQLIEPIARRKQARVNLLTHCNAGWLATVDYGTALAPVYAAHDSGLDVHVWVDETRPRNQGASLTAFELGAHGVPHTIIADNAGGHLMQHGQVDLCIVGADRVASNGDAANKIGTYLKALAARDNEIPFHVAAPLSTIDWTMMDGVRQIPIEERGAHEVTHMTGLADNGELQTIRIASPGSAAANPAFDVTPARLITSIITERGIVKATAEGLSSLKVFA